MRQLKIQKSITKRETESINVYFSEVSQIPLLSTDEEYKLFGKVESGDSHALEKVVNSNLRFVISVAKQYQNQGMGLEDLISDGNLGLIKAAKRFDRSKGFKFISYAVWWIRQSIMQSIAENSRIIRLPNNHINSIGKINRLSVKLEQELEREPTQEELEQAFQGLDIKVKDSLLYHAPANKISSLDAPVIDNEDLFLHDILENHESTPPDASLSKESLVLDLEKVLSQLNERQRTIICMYYGLMGYQQMTLEEIGEYCSLTRERVRQIKEASIRFLKNRRNSKILKEHI